MSTPHPLDATDLEAMAADLYDQPGHLLRRAHQISQGIFTELVGTEYTPIQYAILRMLHEEPGIDQVSLAKRIGFDSSTTALVASKLAAKGLLERNPSQRDRRLLELELTDSGRVALTGLLDGVHAMRERLLSALNETEQEQFMQLLRKFVHVQNDRSRAPVRRRGESGNGG